MAQAVAQHHADRSALQSNAAAWVRFQSAGTRPGMTGMLPDPRARAALSRRGYAVPVERSRRIADIDFERFDLILAMDKDNLAQLRQRCPAQHAAKIALFLDFAPAAAEDEVPDPYYSDAQGFERVLDLCETAAQGLIEALKTQGYKPTPEK